MSALSATPIGHSHVSSQVAIPLLQMSATRVTSLYGLMDAAYDTKEIHAYSWRLGHVPLINHNPGRGGVKLKMDPPKGNATKSNPIPSASTPT